MDCCSFGRRPIFSRFYPPIIWGSINSTLKNYFGLSSEHHMTFNYELKVKKLSVFFRDGLVDDRISEFLFFIFILILIQEEKYLMERQSKDNEKYEISNKIISWDYNEGSL